MKMHNDLLQANIDLSTIDSIDAVLDSRKWPDQEKSSILKLKNIIETNQDSLGLHDLPESYSAKYVVDRRQKTIVIFILLLLTTIIISNTRYSLYAVLAIFNLIYSIDAIFKLLLFFSAIFSKNVYSSNSSDFKSFSDEELPIYTILIPLYKEKSTLSKLNTALKALNYPKEKLDIKLLLEHDDLDTIDAVGKYFDIDCQKILLPNIYPRTKPKALNIGLYFAKGEFVTIYDAEDIPDPDQLLKAVYSFRKANDPKMACMQAKLIFNNRCDNILTEFFYLEYSIWFQFILKGIENFRFPIPLGGTSNHFRKDILLKVHGWDSYNVTEDADLGMRLYSLGYKTMLLDSFTIESATSNIKNWIGQRSRWIKGYYQTYLVHNRNHKNKSNKISFKNFIFIQSFIGFQSISFALSPILLSSILLSYIFDILPNEVLLSCKANLCFTYMNNLYYAFIADRRALNFKRNSNFYIFLYPFYFILHSLSSFKAIKGLIIKPHFWFRTMR